MNTAVTPYVGVWIETLTRAACIMKRNVTPYVGVWIETVHADAMLWPEAVTPYVGVWIETYILSALRNRPASLPTWECGLKRQSVIFAPPLFRHSLRGSVD